MWTDWLAPPGFMFWVVLLLGGWISLGSLKAQFSRRRRSNFFLGFSVFSAFTTLLLIHLLGDERALGWAYQGGALEGERPMWLIPFGLVFWLLILAEFVGLVFMVRMKKGWFATLSIIVTLLAVQFLTGTPVFQWIWANKVMSLCIAGGYVVVGTLWFLFKWDRFTKVMNRLYQQKFRPWLESHGQLTPEDFAEAPVEIKGEWWDHFNSNNWDDESEQRIEFRPSVFGHKADFLFWMSLWPWSMIETFFADFLVELWNIIYHKFTNVLVAIRDRNWRGTESHQLSDEEMDEFRYNRDKKQWSEEGQQILSQWSDMKSKGGSNPAAAVTSDLQHRLANLIHTVQRHIAQGDVDTATLQGDLEDAATELETVINNGWAGLTGKSSGSNRNQI